MPADLQPAFDAEVQRGEWIGAISLLLTEAERRSAVRERVACYLKAAALFEQQFANNAEAQRILEVVLGLSPDEPAATLKLRELYTRARRRDKLQLLAEDPRKLAAHASIPKPTPQRRTGPEGDGGPPAKILAAGLFIALPASVVAANMRVIGIAEPHDNAGGVLGWLTFVILDLACCALFIACAWLPVRWALRRVGGSALLMMLALLGATFLVAMVPTLSWNAVDALNVQLAPSLPSDVRVRVVDHARWGKSRGRFPVVEEQPARGGSTLLLRSLELAPIGSEHVLRRGQGFFRRPYYSKPR